MTRESLKEKRLFTGRLHYATFNLAGSPLWGLPYNLYGLSSALRPTLSGQHYRAPLRKFYTQNKQVKPEKLHILSG